jgi:DNA-binding NarL/FixJ family response regulator
MPPVGVLAVDHRETSLRELRSIVVASPGFAWVAEARSAEEALEAARGLRPQVVLVAAELPGIDGTETARLLGELLSGAVIEVIPADGELTPKELRALWDRRRPD